MSASFPGRSMPRRRGIPHPRNSVLGNHARDTRFAKLLDRLRALDPAVTGLTAEFVHFVDAERVLSAAETELLRQLLTYGGAAQRSVAARAHDAGRLILVVPRAGTISPWSSKASDIAHVCGLTAARRIERGIAYHVHSSGGLDRSI